MITEAPYASPVATAFDSQVGFAIRRWCAPLLDLPAHAPADAYWEARTRLGNDDVTRRLLRASGTSAYLLDTGLPGEDVLDIGGHAAASQATVREVVRLETVAESLLAETGSSDTFLDRFADRLGEATADAAGVKSILAYRHGFDIPAARPAADEVRAGADAALRAADGNADGLRVTDPALLRHLLWCGVDRGLPIQLHTGYGDRDLDLHRANPILLTSWLRAVESTGVPVLLLHCYPYHREAGYLAQVFDNVYFDVGLAIGYTGAQSPRVVAESLELAPFHKQLYSSDGYGPAELHLLGSVLWRRAVAAVVGGWVTRGDWSARDAARVVLLIGSENARRVYRLA
ncbi:MAG: amidohydrolase family protein [Nocardioidaceae bacterium]